MRKVRRGDRVRVHYTGTLTDGTVFDSTLQREPTEITLGAGRIISGFEDALLGMQEGQTRTVRIPPEKGYGPHRDELVMVIDRRKIPAETELKVGQEIRVADEAGHALCGEVVRMTKSSVCVDTNHLLAGKELVFTLRLLEILPGTGSGGR